MRKTFVFAVLVDSLLIAASWGQGLPDQLNFSRSNTEGFHLYGVSTFYAYSTYSFLPRPALTPIDTRSQYGVGGTVGWQHFRSKLNVSARYSANYDGTVQYSALNRVNQSLVIDLMRSLGNKWNISLSATGQDLSLNQSIFQPSSLGAYAQSSASFSDLSAAFSIGQFSSGQSAVTLSGSAGATSSTLSMLLGSRVLSYTARASATYQHSSRLSFQFGSFALGGESRSGIANNYVVPRTLGGTASMSMSYSLSPRTTLGLGLAQNLTSSSYQKASLTNATASIGRKMGKNWFLTVNGGGAFTETLEQSSGAAPMRQVIWGGSLGYRTRAHTFLGWYNRSGYDSSIAVVGANTNFSGAWNWRHPGSRWGFYSTYTHDDTSNGGLSTLAGWHARAGISRDLGSNMTMLVDMTYYRSSGVFQGVASSGTVRAIRVSLGWTPGLTRRPSAPADEDPEVK